MKTFGPMPDDADLHRAALAYASDYTLLESILRRHGLSWITPGMTVASLDHAMWWHRPVRVDEWLLYVQESPSAQGARGLATGKIFSRDGRHVASVAQEGMIRVPTDLRTRWRAPSQSKVLQHQIRKAERGLTVRRLPHWQHAKAGSPSGSRPFRGAVSPCGLSRG